MEESGHFHPKERYRIEIQQGTVFWDWRVYKQPESEVCDGHVYADLWGYGHSEAEAKQLALGAIRKRESDAEARSRLKPAYSYEV